MKTLSGWGSTSLCLPSGGWTNVLAGVKVEAGKVEMSHLFETFPVALLVKDFNAQV
jgi:maltooligosyltrehalose synthase